MYTSPLAANIIGLSTDAIQLPTDQHEFSPGGGFIEGVNYLIGASKVHCLFIKVFIAQYIGFYYIIAFRSLPILRRLT